MADEKTQKRNVIDLYKELWKGRDLEIKNLWQRSIFLTAFMLMIFTGYAQLINLIIDNQRMLVYPLNLLITFLVLMVLSIMGICFSVLWIAMAKGSKYWYECYEASLDQMVNSREWKDSLFDESLFQLWKRIENPKDRLCHGHLLDKKNNNRLFSNRGGQFSVSKINIVIGQIFFIFWEVVSILQIILFYRAYCLFVHTHRISYPMNNFIVFIIIIISFLLYFIPQKIKKLVKSSNG